MRALERLLAICALLACVAAAQAQIQKHTTNKIWSGYVLTSANITQATLPTTFSAISATWKQPKVTCPSPGAAVSFWVGFDGDGTSTVEQAGTSVVCGPHGPVYRAFWEMFVPNHQIGGQLPIVSPGDLITASVAYGEDGDSYMLMVENLSTGKTFPKSITCGSAVPCRRGTAEWIVERSNHASVLADYGTVEFTGLKVTSTGAAPERIAIDMAMGGTTLSHCGPKVNEPAPMPRLPFTADFTCKWVAGQ